EQEAAVASPLPPSLYRRPPASKAETEPTASPPPSWDGVSTGGAGPSREPVNEAYTADPSGLAAKYKGEAGARRARYIRHLLDGCLERWGSFGESAPLSLLREGLLVLEAGHVLDEAHLSLLLRSALYYRRGLVTALRHEADPERAALLIKEAVMEWEPP